MGKTSGGMGVLNRTPERRSAHADELVRALREARSPLPFDEFLLAVPDCSVAELSAWLGNAVQEGLVREAVETEGFELTRRGRRVFSTRRRRIERPDAVAV